MPEPPDESPPQRPDVPSEFPMPREVSPGRTPKRSRGRSETGGTPPPRPEGTPAPSDPIAVPTSPDLVADSMISRPLAELMARTTARQRIGVVIELSSTHPEGIEGAARDVEALLRRVAPKAPVRPTRSYVITALDQDRDSQSCSGRTESGEQYLWRDLADEPCPAVGDPQNLAELRGQRAHPQNRRHDEMRRGAAFVQRDGDRPRLGCPRLRHRPPACSLRAARQSRSEKR